MATLLMFITIICSYLIGYHKRRGEYLELRADYTTLVQEDAREIREFRDLNESLQSYIRFLESEIQRLEND